MKTGKKCRVICHEDMTDHDHASIGNFLGAPVIAIEKVTTGNEVLGAVRTIKEYSKSLGKDVTAIIPLEIGGMNSIAPLYTAA